LKVRAIAIQPVPPPVSGTGPSEALLKKRECGKFLTKLNDFNRSDGTVNQPSYEFEGLGSFYIQ
jgi:hypothetical protein